MSEFKCLPICWKDSRKVKDYDKIDNIQKNVCDKYNDKNYKEKKRAEGCGKDAGNKCIWIDPSEYVLFQSPWAKSVAYLDIKDPTPKELETWVEYATEVPDNWDPDKAKDNVPKLISVNLLQFSLILKLYIIHHIFHIPGIKGSGW